MKQLLLDIAPPPAPTLDNFVTGRNGELVIALYALANGASHERFIYLWGAAGSGCCHLLRAALDSARRNGRCTAWFDAAAATFDAADDRFCAVDDVHRLGPEAQIAMFNLYNRIRGGTGVLIASGDAAPAQLRLRADLVTRLAAGLVYQVHGLNDDEKSAALRRHAEARGFRLSQEVTDYVLRHARRDMPSLLALLDALDRHSLETKRAITVPLLRDLLDAKSRPA
jgi:DnaA-homolog protein